MKEIKRKYRIYFAVLLKKYVFNKYLAWIQMGSSWFSATCLNRESTHAHRWRLYLCCQSCRVRQAAQTVCGGLHVAVRQLAARASGRNAAAHRCRAHGVKHFWTNTRSRLNAAVLNFTAVYCFTCSFHLL